MTGPSYDIAPTMWAIRLHAAGGPDELVLERIETPHPAVGEALVRVHAAAITPDELDWPTDRLPATPSYELSGEVAAFAPDVDTLAVGDDVWALSDFGRDGAAAEYIAIQASLLPPKPRTLGHEESAAVPLSALSAWQGLFDHGGLMEGERVMIHGAAGGVGHFATQLARGRGAYVIGTTSPAAPTSRVASARTRSSTRPTSISKARSTPSTSSSTRSGARASNVRPRSSARRAARLDRRRTDGRVRGQDRDRRISSSSRTERSSSSSRA